MAKGRWRKRFKVAWKIVRPALGVLTVAAPGTREAAIAAVVMRAIQKGVKKRDKTVTRYEQAMIAKARIEQLIKLYETEMTGGAALEGKLYDALSDVKGEDDASEEV